MHTISRVGLEMLAAALLVLLFDSAGRWVKGWREPGPL
jgi:hypothetical protein